MNDASPHTDGPGGWRGESIPRWVRGGLLLAVLGVLVVFATAWRIDPYRGLGASERMGTHQQLGLPPCTFLEVTGVPCPSCGLTTSFSYTVRGDLINGARANWVGVVLCLACALAIPWGAASAVAGRALFVPSLEKLLVYSVLGLFVLLFVRWGLVVACGMWARLPGSGP